MKADRSDHAKPATPGFAALTVVLILFFVMALVAAYTNRNLIFEQRISSSSYQAARALHAADAAQDWTLAMLNAGRIDSACQPSTDEANSDFRRRYLTESIDSGYDVVRRGAPLAQWLRPACVFTVAGEMACICPSMANPDPAIPLTDGMGSAFSVRFILPGNAVRPGTLALLARGCATPGTGASSCLTQTDDRPIVDALVSTQATLGLLRALPNAPVAVLTANGAITGMGDANKPATLPAVTDEAGFAALFGMDRVTYQRQPGVVRMACNGVCTSSNLGPVLAGHPRNTIWVQGDLTLDTAGPLGNAVDPMMLIVTGTLSVAANAKIFGFVHANRIAWAAGAEAASLQGAMVSATDFAATTAPNLSYNKELLDIIRLRYGSFVRVPGGWNLTSSQ